MSCEFDVLREHVPSECPRCNPTGWMAEPKPVDPNDPEPSP